MKNFTLVLLLLACLAPWNSLRAQSNIWQLSGSDISTTIESNAASSSTGFPLINMNWNYPDPGSGGGETRMNPTFIYRNYRLINNGDIYLKYSSDNSSYTNVARFGWTNSTFYNPVAFNGAITSNSNIISHQTILALNAPISIGTQLGDISIGSHKFQVKGSSNLIGDLDISGTIDAQNTLDVSGVSTFDNNLKIKNQHYLEFGNGETKNIDAGKINYSIGQYDLLNIYGAGEGLEERTVKIHDRLIIGADNFSAAGHDDWNLAVNGKIVSKSVVCRLTNWSDFVFEKDYELMKISELKKFIQINGHLPGVPIEKQVIEEGIEIGEMNKILLQKIEELTLYVIELENKINKIQ